MPRYCPNCGTKQEDGAKFCTNCGTPLEPEHEPEKPTVQQDAGTPKPLNMATSPMGNGAGSGNDHPKSSKKRYLAIGAVALVLIGATGFFVGKQFTAKDNPAPAVEQAADTTTEKKQPEMSSELSLGGLDLGITLDEMHNRLGQEDSSKQEGNYMYYFYDGLKVGSVDNKLTSLVSDNDKVETKRGIHQGSTFDEVVNAYGDSYNKMAYDGKQLYEYTFDSIDGKTGILRFAISPDTNRVAYISVRIPDKGANTATNSSQQANKDVIQVLYTGGKTSPLHLSKSNVQLHVGQSIHLMAGDDSGDAGELRLMTNNNRNDMGIVSPQNCVSVKGVGKAGYKGSSTEKLITANAPGEAVFTIVPNYGSWENAAKIYITIVQ